MDTDAYAVQRARIFNSIPLKYQFAEHVENGCPIKEWDMLMLPRHFASADFDLCCSFAAHGFVESDATLDVFVPAQIEAEHSSAPPKQFWPGASRALAIHKAYREASLRKKPSRDGTQSSGGSGGVIADPFGDCPGGGGCNELPSPSLQQPSPRNTHAY